MSKVEVIDLRKVEVILGLLQSVSFQALLILVVVLTTYLGGLFR